MKNNQKGFGVVEAFLIIVIIGLLGFVGWYVWNSSNDTKNTLSNLDKSSSAIINQTANLTIEEWGVKFPITASGKYSTKLAPYGPQGVFGGPTDMQDLGIQVTGFAKDENECSQPYDAGYIWRHKDQNPLIKSSKLNPIVVIKIGDWWYSTNGIEAKQDSICFKGKKEISAQYNALSTKFLEDFKKIQAIKQ